MKLIIFFIVIAVAIFLVLKNKVNFSSKINYFSYLENLYPKFKNNFEENNKYTNLNNVDKVYCVVMPQRKDYMRDVFNKMGINYTFFNAITPKNVTGYEYNQLSTTNVSGSKLYNHPTRLALQMSFTMCFMDAIKNGYSTIIIFEDDIVVNNITTLAKSISDFKDSNFVFFYMGYCWMNCKQNFIKNNLIDVPDKKLFCCHAICYKVKYLKDLIISMYPMDNNFDDNVDNFIKNNNYNVCISPTTFFDQNRSQLETLNEDDNDGNLPNCNKNFI
jgi:hypothetical protein